MGNAESAEQGSYDSGSSDSQQTSSIHKQQQQHPPPQQSFAANINRVNSKNKNGVPTSPSSPYMEFFTSAGKTISEASGIVCGAIEDTFEGDDSKNGGGVNGTMKKSHRNPNISNHQRPSSSGSSGSANVNTIKYTEDETGSKSSKNSKNKTKNSKKNTNDTTTSTTSSATNPMSALFARALLSEVTDNPSTMTSAEITQREKKLLRAQQRAKNPNLPLPPALSGSSSSNANEPHTLPPMLLAEHRAQVRPANSILQLAGNAPARHRITIGLSLSRRHDSLGHTDTVTRQTAFDLNELQDREYKYVSSTDSSGWRAGGGEGVVAPKNDGGDSSGSEEEEDDEPQTHTQNPQFPKTAAPDTVHIPILHMDCTSAAQVDLVIAALARGEIFIPHMSILPSSLGVNGISPPELVLKFECERTDDVPPEEWPNWCLEFMHNQLYDYFSPILGVAGGSGRNTGVVGGARWTARPFQMVLARKVRWKTVKHMNKFFSHNEHVITGWREQGCQTLTPENGYIQGGATPEEVDKPHGIYLLRNGKPTNYFPPNFEPPYTTKMTRSLLMNVLGKSWDRKKRDWTSEPLQKVVSPAMILSTMCGCTDVSQTGFIASEATDKVQQQQGFDTALMGGNSGYFGEGGDLDRDLSSRVMRQQMGLGTLESGEGSSTGNEQPPAVVVKEEKEERVSRKSSSSSSSKQQQQQGRGVSSSSGKKKERSSSKKKKQQVSTSNVAVHDDMAVGNAVTSSPGPALDQQEPATSDSNLNTSVNGGVKTPTSTKRNSSRKKSGDGSGGGGKVVAQQSLQLPEPISLFQELQPPEHQQQSKDLISSPPRTKESNLDMDGFELPVMDNQKQPQKQKKQKKQKKNKQKKQQQLQQLQQQQQLEQQHQHEQHLQQQQQQQQQNQEQQQHNHQQQQQQQQQQNQHQFRQHNPIISDRIPEDAEAEHHHTNHSSTDGHDISNPNSNRSKFLVEVEPTHSIASFETGRGSDSIADSQNISIGESHTTIPTMNGSSAKFIEQERERRKLREVEREKERKKIDAIQEKLQYNAGVNFKRIEAIGEEEQQPQEVTEIDENSKLIGKSPKKERKREKKEKKKKREKKDRDKHHRDSSGTRKQSSRKESAKKMNAADLDAVNQETRQQPQDQEAQDELRPLHGMAGGNIPNQKEELRDSFSSFMKPTRDSSYLPINLNTPTSTNTPGSKLFGNSPSKHSPEISSQISMDYSMDTASLLGDGSLLGGQFAGDGSVITLGTAASENRSLISCVTRSTVHEASPASGWNRNNASTPISESDADDISLSLLASSSSGIDQIVPTDEELFTIGWAKAMDQNSGSYYYFTLDRTKTVWDNPLLNSSA